MLHVAPRFYDDLVADSIQHPCFEHSVRAENRDVISRDWAHQEDPNGFSWTSFCWLSIQLTVLCRRDSGVS